MIIMRENWKNNFSDWYNDIIERAQILDVRYPVKGLYVWFPFGFKLRKHTLEIIREILDSTGHQESLFPLLIPEQEFAKEAKHIKGFENEVYWVTHGGLDPLNVKLALRPTSETIFYPMYKLWVRAHTDFPLKVYQVVNSFRYETKHTRPLIRLREISTFKEAHTVHGSKEDAGAQMEEAMRAYSEFFTRLGIPFILSRRPDWDKFPGAEYTMAFDTIFPDGRALQIGTVHNLGQTFAHTFDIQFENLEGEQEYAFQTCYGISDRVIAAAISVHGDDKGLCLVPEIAPIQIVFIPIWFKDKKEEVTREVKKLAEELTQYRTHIDDRELRPGAKFFDWEIKGVPLRVELGPKDMEKGQVVAVRRDTGEKSFVKRENLKEELDRIMTQMTAKMRKMARKEMESMIHRADTIEEIKATFARDGGVIKTTWCGRESCGKELEEVSGVDILGILDEKTTGKCVMCQGEGSHVIQMAKTY